MMITHTPGIRGGKYPLAFAWQSIFALWTIEKYLKPPPIRRGSLGFFEIYLTDNFRQAIIQWIAVNFRIRNWHLACAWIAFLERPKRLRLPSEREYTWKDSSNAWGCRTCRAFEGKANHLHTPPSVSSQIDTNSDKDGGRSCWKLSGTDKLLDGFISEALLVAILIQRKW